MSGRVEDVVAIVRRVGGIATWSQMAPDVGRRAVARAVTEGAVRRAGRGVYATPDAPADRVTAAVLHGTLSHVSAAAHWGLEPLHPATRTHVTVPRRARPVPVPRGVRLHWAEVVGAEDVGGVTSVVRTVVDCSATLSPGEGLAVADAALRRGLVEQDELTSAAARRRGPGARRARWVAHHANGLAANGFESQLRAHALAAGATGLVPQLPIRAGGTTFVVDLGDHRRRLALEADSFAFHGSRHALHRDCTRYDELVREGWVVLRFSWEHVMTEADWVLAVISDVVQDAGQKSAGQNRTVAKVPTRRKPTRS